MMIFLNLLLSSGLIFIAETASIRNESLCYRPSKYIKPTHYDIKHILYIEGNIIYGEYKISISILSKTQHIYLPSVKLCIKNIVLFKSLGKSHKNDRHFTIMYKPTYNIKANIIDVFFMDDLSPGNYTLHIKYMGTADEGFTIFDVKERSAWIATTHFQIIDAGLFPCRQQELLEATFKISIRCNQCMVLSNIPLRNTKQIVNNMLWTHSFITYAMSPYLATIIVSNYLLRVYNDTQNIEVWCRNEFVIHFEFAKNVAENITKKSLKINGNNYKKLGKQTILSSKKETDIINSKDIYPVTRDIEVTQLVGRKVIEEWFYDLMNHPLVSDFWFNNGLVTLIAMYTVNEVLC
ncbi:endoplasmic reticulum aminopeptidase 1-like [Nylanderia fulva]|uniref:endoplasmic reticulum aminopeptidase 1-like n=1 Tax=Nylanderia fulva TaxID=613905 RepID=UPI0010FB4521|nr:endoplasmic reticulum aminopeptidase 1-like [Nylanderia fulva]